MLNSIAIGFVFEIDNVLYQTVLPLYKRLRHQRMDMVSPVHPLAQRDGTSRIAQLWVWPLVAIDISVGVFYYFAFEAAGNKLDDIIQVSYYLEPPFAMMFFMMFRAGAFAAASLHLNARMLFAPECSSRGLASKYTLVDALRLLLSVAASLACGFFAYKLYDWMNAHMGYGLTYALPGSDMYECLHGTDVIPECTTFEAVTPAQVDLLSRAPFGNVTEAEMEQAYNLSNVLLGWSHSYVTRVPSWWDLSAMVG